MNIVIIGPSGSGKTTLAKALHEELNLPLISSGRIAREISEADPSTDMALKQGAFAPERSMRAAVKTELEAAEVQRSGWILDGFPRMIEQLVCLMQWTSGMPLFINLDVEIWTCLERLVARGRTDDNPDAIARKFANFKEHTWPMIELLESGGVLHTITGDTGLEEQIEDVRNLLR